MPDTLPELGLLTRTTERLPASRPLVVGLDPAGLPDLLSVLPSPTLHTTSHGAGRQLRGAAVPVVARPWYRADERHDGALVFLPQGRERLRMVLSMVAAAVLPGAPVWLVGQNKAGVRSAEGTLREVLGEPVTLDTMNKCRLYRVARPRDRDLPPDGAGSHLQDWEVRFEVEHPALPRPIQVVGFPGVFSHDRLDRGTAVLLRHLALLRLDEGVERVLDLCCGTGVLGAAAAMLAPQAHVDLADDDLLAVEAARRTLEANGLVNGEAFSSHGWSVFRPSERGRGRYDVLLLNPPFHDGVQTSHDAVKRILADAPEHLVPTARTRVVANRHLRRQELVRESFGMADLLDEAEGFQVIGAFGGTGA